MSFFEEAQTYETDFYGLKNTLLFHITNRSLKAFEKADIRRNRVKTKEDFLKYQQKSKNAFLKSMGKIPYNKTLPLNAKITGTSVYKGVKIENIIFQSRDGVYVTANLYMPENNTGKLPAVLVQCGHSAAGRLYPTYRRVALTIAKASMIALVFDPIGQGERRSYPELFAPTASPVYEHQYCGNQCFMAGMTPTAYFIADAMRAIDYLESRADVDSDKIGATGASGGGTMTAVMGVVDDRIKAAAPCVFITTRRDYMYTGARQDFEQIWFGATENLFDHYELISCFCPKPYMILGAKSDFFCREGTEKVYNKNKEFYRLFGKEENLKAEWENCTHSYPPKLAKAAAEFFAGVFLDKKVNAEVVEPTEDYNNLMATKSGQLISEPEGKLPVFEQNKLEFENKTIKNQKHELLKRIYKDRKPVAFNVRYPFPSVTEDGITYRKILWFSQEHMPCYGVLFTGENCKPSSYVICLWQDGTDKIVEKQQKIKDMVNSGKAVLVTDLSGMGKLAPYPTTTSMTLEKTIIKLNADLIFLGDSLCAVRSFDLINTINMLKEEFEASDVSLYAEGSYCTYADILDKTDMHTDAVRINPVTPQSVITNKLYDDSGIDNIVMHSIGLYLK